MGKRNAILIPAQLSKDTQVKCRYRTVPQPSSLREKERIQMAVKILNYMPHDATVLTEDGEVIKFVSQGVARVAVAQGSLEELGGITIKGRDVFGEIEGLPDPSPGVYFIVSAVVGANKGSRTDLLMPGTGPADNPVRFEEGPLKGKVKMVRLLKRA